jgi:HAD superfamily hydrolase (TIGR01662 family)
MSEETLNEIHDKMLAEVNVVSGMVEKIYYCIDVDQSSVCRKPNIGMGLKAKIEFPEIDFSKSVMVGDSISDMLFGKNLGMKTIFVGKKSENNKLDGVSTP